MSEPGLPPHPGGQPPAGPPWPGPPGHGPYPQHPAGSWQQPGSPPGPARGSNRRWLLLALAFLAVIAVSVSCTVWFTHKGSGNQGGSGGGGPQSSNSSSGEIASANDTGPVGIITEEPTCDSWVAMQNQVATQLADWGNRDASVPASAWTPDQRQIYDTAARVLQAQADRLVPLARETPHRVMRELYEQLIAYARAYANAVPRYAPADDKLALVGNSLGATLSGICVAITNFAAVNRAPSVPPAEPSTAIAPVGDPGNPQRFLTGPSDACPKVKALADRKQLELEQWFKTDPNVPAAQRSATDSILWDSAAKVFGRGAGELERIGRSSGNPIMEDFLVLSAQYYRAYVNAIPNSTLADEQIYQAAQQAQVSVLGACDAVQG